jgi:hypothetical protein
MLTELLERLATSWAKSKHEFPDIIEDIKGGMKSVGTWARLVDRESKLDSFLESAAWFQADLLFSSERRGRHSRRNEIV